MAAVSNRYVDALLSLGDAEDRKSYLECLRMVSDFYTREEFKTIIDNPRITNKEKFEIVKGIVPNNDVFLRFIDLIIKEGRLGIISDICNKYESALDRIDKKIKLKIISARKLSLDEEKQISNEFLRLFEANSVSYDVFIDEALIGGIKVIVDDKVYDGTIKRKLNEILN